MGQERGAVCAAARDRVGRASALVLRGNHAEADNELAEVEIQIRALGRPWEVSLALSSRGQIMLDRGEWTRAEPMLAEAVALLISIGDIYLLTHVVQQLAIVLAYSDDARRSAVPFGACAALSDQSGHVSLSVLARDGAHAAEKVVVELGQEGYDVLFGEGRGMPSRDLLAFVTPAESAPDRATSRH
ncbi:MAG TPA: hypothetical protein VGM75_36910 [Pseudonocardiaceae bacterium]